MQAIKMINIHCIPSEDVYFANNNNVVAVLPSKELNKKKNIVFDFTLWIWFFLSCSVRRASFTIQSVAFVSDHQQNYLFKWKKSTYREYNISQANTNLYMFENLNKLCSSIGKWNRCLFSWLLNAGNTQFDRLFDRHFYSLFWIEWCLNWFGNCVYNKG